MPGRQRRLEFAVGTAADEHRILDTLDDDVHAGLRVVVERDLAMRVVADQPPVISRRLLPAGRVGIHHHRHVRQVLELDQFGLDRVAHRRLRRAAAAQRARRGRLGFGGARRCRLARRRRRAGSRRLRAAPRPVPAAVRQRPLVPAMPPAAARQLLRKARQHRRGLGRRRRARHRRLQRRGGGVADMRRQSLADLPVIGDALPSCRTGPLRGGASGDTSGGGRSMAGDGSRVSGGGRSAAPRWAAARRAPARAAWICSTACSACASPSPWTKF